MKPFALVFLSWLLVTAAWAQIADSTQSGTNQPVSGTTMTPWLPTAINGEYGSLQFASEAERSNILSGGLSLATGYDDNALSNNKDRIGNVSYAVMPFIAISESRTRHLWHFNYSPGFTFNQRLAQNYAASHNLDFSWQYRITERFTARVHENFIDETTSFDRLTENPLLPGGNVLHQPNDSVITPLTNRIGNLTNLDLIYQLGEGTTAGASGTFSKQSYKDTAQNTGTQLIDNETGSADAFYSHRFSPRNTLGFTYTFQKFATLGQIREHSTSHSVLVFYTLNLKPNMALSFFGGPDRNVTNDQYTIIFFPFIIPISKTQSRWMVDGGMTFGWQGQRTSMRANFIRHVTDGGGLVGAVTAYSSSGDVRRQLTQRWTGIVGLSYGNNDPLSRAYGNAFWSTSATAGLQRSIGQKVTIGISYARDHQSYRTYGTPLLAPVLADHNRGWVTISYHFDRPLGR